MNSFQTWLEATTNYVEKMVDPALMTFGEFWEKVNPCNRWHQETAYNYPVSKFDRYSKSDYPILVNNVTIKGIRFEIRLKKGDLCQDKVFAKRDPSGEYLRDENHQLIYYTKQELLALSKFVRYEYSFVAFDGEQAVGAAQDEWGAMLITVAQEYRNFGLGSILAKLAYEAEPGKNSGGCTNKGAELVRKVHAEFVKDYLQKGFYSFLVKEKKITAQRVKDIVSSAKLNYKPSKKDDTVLGSDDPENWLLMVHNGTFIVYDKLLKDLYKDEDKSYWADKCIKAFGDVGPSSNDKDYRLRNLGGVSDGLKKWMVYLCVSWTAEEDGKPLYVYQEDLAYVDHKLMEVRPVEKAGWVSLISQPASYKDLSRQEKKWRKTFDKYGEFEQIVIEMAYNVFGS